MLGDKIVIGFTGTQDGMTSEQHQMVSRMLAAYRGKDEFHYGDCVGADEEAFLIANDFGLCTVAHPPIKEDKCAFTNSVKRMRPKPYLERNRDIVDVADFLIAMPAQKNEHLRSGTWSTIRYARRKGKPVWIVFPDGTLGSIN